MHWSGEIILLVFICAVTAIMLLLLHLTKLGLILRENLPDRPHRRNLLASISFFITFQYVTMGGRHIHHLVWGILILLGVGYGYINEVGSGSTPASIFAGRLMSILYGVGAALTLDEFALWLNLAPVYWSREGRESIDAVVLFGALLAMGTWGAPLYSAMLRKK
jgi:hypothetical protein